MITNKETCALGESMYDYYLFEGSQRKYVIAFRDKKYSFIDLKLPQYNTMVENNDRNYYDLAIYSEIETLNDFDVNCRTLYSSRCIDLVTKYNLEQAIKNVEVCKEDKKRRM